MKPIETDEVERVTKGVLGDINPNPGAQDHLPKSGPNAKEDDVVPRRVEDLDTGIGGTRNYRQGTGATGGDVGNRPE